MKNELTEYVFCVTNLQAKAITMRMLLLLLLGFILLHPVQAQSVHNRDSLQKLIEVTPNDSTKVKLYYLLANEYSSEDLKKAEEFCEKGLALSLELEYKQGVLDYYAQYATVMNFRGDFGGALKLNLEALQYAKEHADPVEIARTMLNVGIAYRQLNDYETAVTYVEEGKNTLLKMGVHQYEAETFNLLQLLYYSMHQYRKGVRNGLLAIRAIGERGDQDLLRKSYNNLGLNYLSLRLYDSAKYYLTKANVEAKKHGDVVIQITTSLNFAQIALYQQSLDDIKFQADQALALSQKYGAHEFEGLAEYGLAYYYLLKKDYTTSALHANSALRLANQYNMLDLKKKVYAILSSLHYGEQNTKLGYYYFDQYEMLSDSMLNASITNNTIRIEKKLETERKDAQIKLQQAQLNQKTTLNYFLIAGTVALAAILLLSYRNYRSRQKLQQSKIEELETEKQLTATAAVLKGEEQERTRLAKDLHDGLGGMLSGIKFSLNNMKGNLVMTPDNARAFERSIDLLDSSIQEMRRVAHNMMPEILLKYGLDTALKEFCTEIDRSGVLHVTYQPAGVTNTTLEQTQAVTIYRIVQELVSNAIKHASARNVLVQVHRLEQEKMLAITVEDDGKGFDTNLLNRSGGIGWKNIQNRVEFLKGRLDIQSAPGKGTSVMIELTIA